VYTYLALVIIPQLTMEDHNSLALSSFVNMPDLEVVKKRFVGQPIDSLPTPAVLIDRSKVESNIAKMQKTVTDWHCLFRAHIKTHKTREGTVLQLAHSSNRSIIVSTLAEAWGIVKSGLIEEGTVDDVSKH
jgi:D-serine deaminase-like pyridoxal phosphate-dependent protein